MLPFSNRIEGFEIYPRKTNSSVRKKHPRAHWGPHLNTFSQQKRKAGDHGPLFAETGEAKKAVNGHTRFEMRFRSSRGPCEQGKCR